MFKLPHNYIHFTYQQDNVQNPSSQTSTVCELRTSRYPSWIQKRQRSQRSNCQHLLDHRKPRNSTETSTSASLTVLKPLTVWITANWKILKEMRIPKHHIFILRNLYASKKETELDMGQWTDSKLGKEYVKAYTGILLI